MNDGRQSTSELQNMIFESAQRSRGNYLGITDSIGKMGLMAGDFFSSAREVIGFMELINKQFKIAGTNTAGIDAAMLQLTQAMGSGVLRGEEYNSILEQAPIIIQNIAKYLGVPKGQLKNMAAEGKVTAEIVKNAMFYAANDINQKFEAIPETFGDAVINMKNNFVREFAPISQNLNSFANSEGFTLFTDMVVKGMGVVIDVTTIALNFIGKIGKTMYDNWNVIGPVIGAVTSAVIAYKSAVILSNIALMKNNVLQGKNILGAVALAGKNIYLATTTFIGTAAQEGFNAALYACPITWIVGGIMLTVGALYGLVAAFNAVTGKSVSATGIIVGGIGVIVATVVNMGITIWNTLINVAEFMMNVFTHPIYAIEKLIGNFIIEFIEKIKFLANVSDKVLGTNFNATLNDAKLWIETKLEATKPENYANASDLKFNYVDTIGFGKSFYDKGANLFSGVNDKSIDMAETNEYLAEINKNTVSMSEGMDLTTEEIKYMRDVTEMEVINKFTTAEIKMEVQNSNMISNNMDIHDVIDEFTEYLKEKMQMTAEGVHT